MPSRHAICVEIEQYLRALSDHMGLDRGPFDADALMDDFIGIIRSNWETLPEGFRIMPEMQGWFATFEDFDKDEQPSDEQLEGFVAALRKIAL